MNEYERNRQGAVDPRANLKTELFNKVRVVTWDEEEFPSRDLCSIEPDLIHFVQVETLFGGQVISSRYRMTAMDLERRAKQLGSYSKDFWVREVAIPQLMGNIFREIGKIRNGNIGTNQ